MQHGASFQAGDRRGNLHLPLYVSYFLSIILSFSISSIRVSTCRTGRGTGCSMGLPFKLVIRVATFIFPCIFLTSCLSSFLFPFLPSVFLGAGLGRGLPFKLVNGVATLTFPCLFLASCLSSFPAPFFYPCFYVQDWAARYWVQQGASPDKLVIGVATFGRSFTLMSPSQNGLGAPARGGGQAGPNTREAGFLAYYEVCGMRHGARASGRRGRI